MRNYKLYFLKLLILFVIISGCDDQLLDIESRDTFSIDIALSTLDGLEGAILGVYDQGKRPYSDTDISLYKTFYTDIVKEGTHIADQRIWLEMMTFAGFDAANEGVRRIYETYYSALEKANTIISLIDEVEYNRENKDDVDRRNIVLGEALYFRAFFHLNLVEYWDNIFLSDRVFSDPNHKFELASKEEVYDLIESDLITAIPLLPEADKVDSRGKVTKGVARHTLSLVYMNLENWASAALYADLVINDPAYQLVDDVETIFSELDQDNSEIILSWQFIPFDINYSQRASAQFVPLYDRVNGVSRTFEQGGRPWSRMSVTEYYWTLWMDDNGDPLEPGDTRLEAWHKLHWIYDDEANLPAGVQLGDTVVYDTTVYTAELDLGPRLIEPTTKKYWEYDGIGRTIDLDQGFKNMVQYRLAEAYIIAAEAYMNLGDNKAVDRLNAIRERAGASLFAEVTIQTILDEQARELGFEGRRYPMLKRLGLVLDRVKAGSPDIGGQMQDFHVRWPIPKNVKDLSGVKQNDGYN